MGREAREEIENKRPTGYSYLFQQKYEAQCGKVANGATISSIQSLIYLFIDVLILWSNKSPPSLFYQHLCKVEIIVMKTVDYKKNTIVIVVYSMLHDSPAVAHLACDMQLLSLVHRPRIRSISP